MTSKLVVNTIEADTGISSVSFASSISMSSTSKFHFSDAGIDIGADTNINRPAAGVLGFNINSAEKLRIDSNGHLNTSGIATASNFKTGSSNLHSTGLTVGNNFLHSTGINVGTGATIHVPATNVLTLGTNSNERLRIDSSGRLLVGTNSSSSSVRAVFQGYPGGGSNFQARVQFQTNQATNLSADHHLANLLFTNASNSVGAQIDVKADAAWGTNDYPARIEFKTTADSANSPTERLRIASGGEVSIGGFAPTAGAGILQIAGGLRVAGSGSASDTNTPYIYRTSGADNLNFATSGTERLRIESGGDVSIGGMDANTFSNYRTLTIGGAGAVNGAGIDLERSDGTIYGRLFADTNGLQIGAPASGDYIRFELGGSAYAKVDADFGLKADNTCKTWLCYRSEAGNEGIIDDYNVASVNDEGTGSFAVTLDRNIHRHGNGWSQSIVFGCYNDGSRQLIAGVGYAPSHGSNNPWWDVEDNFVRVNTQRSTDGVKVDAKVFNMAMFGDTGDLDPA